MYGDKESRNETPGREHVQEDPFDPVTAVARASENIEGVHKSARALVEASIVDQDDLHMHFGIHGLVCRRPGTWREDANTDTRWR